MAVSAVKNAGAWTAVAVGVAVLAAGASVVGGGCRRVTRAPVAPARAAVVAVVADVPISTDDVRLQMRARRVDARRALDDLITFEVLARAAADARLDRAADAADRSALISAKVGRLVQQEIEPALDVSQIPDADVRALYERGKDHFVHGRLVEVAVLCVFTGARMKPAPRARAADNARKLKAYVDAAAPGTGAAFTAIAQDPAWIERQVSVTTVWQGEDTPFPAVVGRAVQALSKPGDTTALVDDETGYYIARYVSERPPENIPFAEAAPGLRRDMYQPWRRQRFLQLSLEMTHVHDISVFPENLPLLAASPRR
ncbi:MAG: peptidylprolyl isomerase [Pseudomonadota bacterium]